MTANKIAKIVCLISMSFLSACLMTRNDVKEAEQKKQIQDQVVTLQKSTADVSGRFQEIEGQLRESNGRLEKLENHAEQDVNQREKMKKSHDEQVNDLQKKIVLLQEEMAKMQSQMGAVNEKMNQQSTQIDAIVARDENAKKETTKNPFDLGEENFSKKEWKKAILHYQKCREASPKGKKFADATYKIGVSFQELGMKEEARSFYEEVVAKFPTTDTAKKAKVRMKQVK